MNALRGRLQGVLGRLVGLRSAPAASAFLHPPSPCCPEHSSPAPPGVPSAQSRGLKIKDHLRRRCRFCYFSRINGCLYVLCKVHPRHKQRENFHWKLMW